jgi:hypothetical protein
MSHSKKNYMIPFLLLMLMLLAPGRSPAMMVGLSTEELTVKSDEVVVGQVQSIESRWSDDGRMIVSSATVLVNEALLGNTAESTVTVEYEGGEVGDLGIKVSDTVPLKRGEDVVLFLKARKDEYRTQALNGGGRAYRLVGRAQGKYVVGSDGIARKRGFSLAANPGKVDNDLPVDELIRKIKGVKRQ